MYFDILYASCLCCAYACRGDSVLVRLSSEQRQQLPHKPLELIFTNVTMYVEKRRVLHDISGIVKPGQLLAVMGPSGELLVYS